MARPADPVDDLVRVAELLDSVSTLLLSGCSPYEVADMTTGLANRVREDVARLPQEARRG